MAYTLYRQFKVNGKNIYGATLNGYEFGIDVYVEQSNAVNNYTNVKTVAWVMMNSNSSTVTASTYYFKENSSTYQSLYIKLGVKDTAGYAVPYHANEKIATYYHNADGTKSITLSFSVETEVKEGANANLNNYCLKSASITETFELPTINRLSPFSFTGSFTMGSGKAITISPYVSSFRHNIEVHFGSYKEVVASNIETSYTWTPSRDLGHQIPNSTSGVGTIYVHTYNGGTYIGTESKSFTLWVSGDMYPTLTYTTTGNDLFNGLYITTKSSVSFSLSATESYGAKIKSYSISGQGLNVNSSNGKSSVFSSSGTFTYTLKATDSRGRSVTKTHSISVYYYANPSITLNTVRCDLNGNPTDIGNYVKATLVYSISNPNNANQNAKNYVIEYKATDEENWTTFSNGTLSNYSSTQNYTNTSKTFDSAKSYDFRASIEDSFITIYSTTNIPTATCILDIEPNGLGVGKYHQNGALDVMGDVYLNNSKLFEVGSFNPSFYVSEGTTMIFTRREGRYQKIGKWCMCNISLVVENFSGGSDSTNQFKVIELPFINKGTYSACTIGYCSGINTSYDIKAYIRPNENDIVFVTRNGVNITTITGNATSSTMDVQLSFIYQVEE